MAGVGVGLIVTVTLLLFVQPKAFVSIRVYVVVTAGDTVGFDEVDEKPDGELDHK